MTQARTSTRLPGSLRGRIRMQWRQRHIRSRLSACRVVSSIRKSLWRYAPNRLGCESSSKTRQRQTPRQINNCLLVDKSYVTTFRATRTHFHSHAERAPEIWIRILRITLRSNLWRYPRPWLSQRTQSIAEWRLSYNRSKLKSSDWWHNSKIETSWYINSKKVWKT